MFRQFLSKFDDGFLVDFNVYHIGRTETTGRTMSSSQLAPNRYLDQQRIGRSVFIEEIMDLFCILLAVIK